MKQRSNPSYHHKSWYLIGRAPDIYLMRPHTLNRSFHGAEYHANFTGPGTDMTDKATRKEIQEYVSAGIDTAIDEGYIRVFYQPVVRTLTGEVCGMEALARWDDPHYGLLAPDLFIPSLEKSKQIHKLDTCVIRQICTEYASSVKRNKQIVTVSFNLSRLDFQLCDIHQVIEDAIHDNELPRDVFRVEITESVMENNETRMKGAIDRFWNHGLRVWMDDFGSGYSSLNVLKDYRFDTIKIDMAFLRSFTPRSREIIKSIVDMAKRIGVHTLAEGVETEEQLVFLKNIGCEKAQGYYIGKPMPYADCLAYLKDRGYSLESQQKRRYYHDIGRVNVLSATPLKTALDNTINAIGEEDQIPMAFVELSNDKLCFLFYNDAYQKALQSIGMTGVDQVENDFGNQGTTDGQRFLAMLQQAARSKKVETANLMEGSLHCYAQVRMIAEYPGGNAFLVIFQNLSAQEKAEKENLISDYSRVLFSLYEHIELVDLNTGYSRNIYQSRPTLREYNMIPASEELRIYAEEEIYLEDRERFIRFSNLSTIEERLNEGPSNFISSPFRLRMEDGNYVWYLFIWLYAGLKQERRILCCARRVNSGNIAYLNVDTMRTETHDFLASSHTENGITPELLWKNHVMAADFPFFWKDKDRRYVGVNQRFLAYHGIRNESEVIGKTDEEMGWYINPTPVIKKEREILQSGARIHLLPAAYLCKGEVREVKESKMPIYNEGEIVGLMGYFVDPTEEGGDTPNASGLSMTDPVTGILNFLGITDALLRYQDCFAQENRDFAMLYFDLNGFRKLNNSYGMEWGNALLKAVAGKLKSCIGTKGVVGRMNSDHFVVLHQTKRRREVKSLIKQSKKALEEIGEIDGIACTLYVKCGSCFFSDVRDLQNMFRISREGADAERPEDNGGDYVI